jgi:hypothetical protein
MTIKQNRPPDGWVFTRARKAVLEALGISWKDIVTDWQSGGRGHWNPVITRAIPEADENRVRLNDAYYDRITTRKTLKTGAIAAATPALTSEIQSLYARRQLVIAERHTKRLSARNQSRKLHAMERLYPKLLHIEK